VSQPSVVALIPARAGSTRIRHKNIKRLAGHPLLAYTIEAAKQSGVFSTVIVSTDSPVYANIAGYYGAEVPFLRPSELAGSLSPDIEWVEHCLLTLAQSGRTYECFSILRPTSPFRLPDTICRAWQAFQAEDGVDSLRAVEKCKQHPGKMWVVRGRRMLPLLPLSPPNPPWHSSQYQALPEVYIQNASLEIAWSRIVTEEHTIAGTVIMPFFTEGYEGVDINEPQTWQYVESQVEASQARLPRITIEPFIAEEE